MRVPVPPTPVTVAGSPRLVYEIHLTNSTRDSLVIGRLMIRDADHGTALADWGEEALERRLQKPSAPSDTTRLLTIAPGERRVLYAEISLENTTVPESLEHRVTIRADGQPSTAVQRRRVPVRDRSPVELGPPLRSGPWVAAYNPFWRRGHRRMLYETDGRERLPGRYAIDWMKLGDSGRLAGGDKDSVRNWYGYSADVLAVANAKVVKVHDGADENATLSGHTSPPPEEAAGNYLVLELGQGRYAFYEHLKPGSIRVRPGERVERGQVIASVGFTGSTTGPHLHLHVANGTSPLEAEGLPFVFERFAVVGSFDSISMVGTVPVSSLNRADEVREEAASGRRTGERPGSNVVLHFQVSDAPE